MVPPLASLIVDLPLACSPKLSSALTMACQIYHLSLPGLPGLKEKSRDIGREEVELDL